MPKHFPPPKHDPPSVGDRANGHSVEVMVCVYSIWISSKVVLLGMSGTSTTPALGALPPVLVAVLVGFIFLGGATALHGLLVAQRDVRREINCEQYGWTLLGIGWLGYSISADILNPGISISSDLGYALAAASGWRYLALRRIEKTLELVEEATTGTMPIVPKDRPT